jgi:tetratricopeptide (TPR) repeat protein
MVTGRGQCPGPFHVRYDFRSMSGLSLHRHGRVVALVLLACVAAASRPQATQAPVGQSAPARGTTTPRTPSAVRTLRALPSLGSLSFPNSGAAAAQTPFLRGVAWLHSFGYEDAIEQFQAAQKADPSFALAYWGESLAHSQPLWFGEDPAKGRAALAKLGPTAAARQVKARTPREQGLLAAVEELWGTGDTRARGQKYSAAMARLAQAHPADDEIQLFYALSLLGVLPRGDQSIPMRQRAGAIAEAVFAKNPKHPGAAHYILHAYDHGSLAARGLTAARSYATIAPAVSHALHMPAHAFIQLGYWDEAAEADRSSWDASVQWAARWRLPNTMRDFHSLTWLHYAWTQQGRFREAAGALVLVDEALRSAKPTDQIGGHQYMDSVIGRGIGPEALKNDRGSMRARYIIESARWSEMQGQTTFDGIDELFALGFSAVKLGDAARVEAVIGEFQKAAGPGQPAELQEQARIMLLEMQAVHLFAQGKRAESFVVMDSANQLQSRMPKPIGRPFPVKGADELYAEMLYEAGRHQAAVEWFETTLRRTPNRTRALLGLARAKRRLGDAAGARTAYERVLKNLTRADANLPELREARTALGRP